MRIETALKRKSAATSSLCSLYSAARSCGYTSKQVNTAYQDIMRSLEGCPRWVSQFVHGYRAALDAENYRDHIVFGGFIDGAFLTTHSGREDYYGRHSIDAKEWYERAENRGHYWKAHNPPRPYFIG